MSDPTPVLVVGAGPVGLTTAHELARRGVPVRLVDAAAGPARTSRAIATHPRTLETYEQMGVVSAVIERGERIEGFTMFQRGHRLVRLDADYSRHPTRFPFTLSIDQVLTEEVLREAVAQLGVSVEWGVRLTDFTQDADGVDATLEHSGGRSETVRTSWLVGCDGGHSAVRKKLGLRLVGDSNDTWLLADAEVTVDLPRDSIYWMQVGTGTMMLVPLPGGDRWRMLDTVDVDHGDDDRKVADRFSRKLSAALGRPVRVHQPTWVSVFTAQQRMVERMRVGRCLLAGDAAHVHSPASGQGMNTGIQEAFNLAWKLAMVVHGQARHDLLDSYQAERMPIGARLLESTRTATRLVALRAAAAQVFLPAFFAVVRAVPPLRRRIQHQVLGAMSGLAIAYQDGPLTCPGPTAGPVSPQPGTRLTAALAGPLPAAVAAEVHEELRDPRWSLLVCSGEGAPAGRLVEQLATDHADWLSVRLVDRTDQMADPADGPRRLADPDGALSRALHAAPGGWLLVRPDGYLAARGPRADADSLGPAFARLPLTPPVTDAGRSLTA